MSVLVQNSRYHNVVVVTTTFYTDVDNNRYKLTLESVKLAKLKGIPICVVDASPDGLGIKESFREHGAYVYSQNHKGMGASRRQAFAEGRQNTVFT